MRKLGIYLVGLTLACSAGLGTAAAADAPKGPVAVTNFGKKAVATFDHDKHAELKCVSCHHNEGDGKYTCGECHLLDDGDAPKIKDAFHGKTGACYACHYDKGAEHKMKCNDCHKG